MFVFRKIWRALFSWNTRFENRPFTILPTISCKLYTFRLLAEGRFHTIINDVDGFCENIAEKFKSKFSEQVAERMELIKMKTVTKKDRTKKYISIWTTERDERFSKVSKWQSCG